MIIGVVWKPLIKNRNPVISRGMNSSRDTSKHACSLHLNQIIALIDDEHLDIYFFIELTTVNRLKAVSLDLILNIYF